MKAWVLKNSCDLEKEKHSLQLEDISQPTPFANELLIKVLCCAVCHTELDEIEGRTPPTLFPVVPGHQVVGTVEEWGRHPKKFKPGQRVGVAWIFRPEANANFVKTDSKIFVPTLKEQMQTADMPNTW